MDNDEYGNDSNLVRDLRKQLKEAQAQSKTLQEELAGLKGAARERTVTEVLKSKGLPEKVAKLIPNDVEGEEAVTEWLQEFGEVFGVRTSDGSVEGSSVPREAAQDLRRANALQERSVSPDKVADINQRIDNAQSVDEINAALADLRKYVL